MKKIALVGCGRISKRHIEAIHQIQNLEITLVCDTNEQKAVETAQILGCEYVTDYRELNGIDIVSVLTPSGNHPVHASEIAEKTEVPVIICEKPLSLTVREAEEMFTRIDRTGKRLLPVYQNRYNPLVAYTKKLIDSGKLGKVYQFICDVLWNRDDDYFSIDWHGTKTLDGGVLYTQASHYVDMVHFFFGEVVESKGIGGNLRELAVYDSVSSVMRFENGTIGTINATVNTYQKNYCTEFTLIAEKGIIRLSGTNLNTISHWNVQDMVKPEMDFTIDHVYGKGHDQMYKYVVEEKWNMFPSREDVLSGIRLMERLSY
ncbi:MAG: Gfo/Idh/MocA family oxidoreductase [Candidatus Thermoplasmatota archaeon]|nr:Gfo/Idh/MocA family oxidoreductase [Candidatus Thermoplasmatota archaeon]